ncbi:MAG: dephospho-CoA kinase [Deltaproteobacteria bacterium]|nr:MAG: dephospho-CoA kinase [Deltaproteobacteria bacterium]
MGAPVIGLSGGIGAGKSTVATMLAEWGAHVIDADRVGHDVYRPGTEGFRQVTEAFGTRVVAPDGTIDRRALGGIVFGDPRALARLNAILHPLIVAELGPRIAAARRASVSRPIVVEAAILAEAGWRTLFDRLWVVTARPENAIARVVTSRGMAREEVERRLAAQMPDAERRRLADVVIENDGTPAELCAEVERAWQTLAGT